MFWDSGMQKIQAAVYCQSLDLSLDYKIRQLFFKDKITDYRADYIDILTGLTQF